MTIPLFSSSPSSHHFTGCLLGTAVGDARGLPYEGMSRRRLQALYPHRDTYHLLCGYGLCSDDTEHAFIVGQALVSSTTASGEQQRHDKFLRSLAWRLRFWILGFRRLLPPY